MVFIYSLYFTLTRDYYFIRKQNSRLMVLPPTQHFEDIIQSPSALNKMFAGLDISSLACFCLFFLVFHLRCLGMSLFLFPLLGVHCAFWTEGLWPCIYYGKLSVTAPSDCASLCLLFSGSSLKATPGFLLLQLISLPTPSCPSPYSPVPHSKSFSHISLKSNSFLFNYFYSWLACPLRLFYLLTIIFISRRYIRVFSRSVCCFSNLQCSFTIVLPLSSLVILTPASQEHLPSPEVPTCPSHLLTLLRWDVFPVWLATFYCSSSLAGVVSTTRALGFSFALQDDFTLISEGSTGFHRSGPDSMVISQLKG